MNYLLLALSFGACAAQPTSFEGYSVYSVKPRTRRQSDVFWNFTNNNEHYDFWTPHQYRPERTVMVTPQMQNYFHSFLEDQQIPYSIKIPNLERLLEKERVSQRFFQNDDMGFKRYYRYHEILGYLTRLSRKYDNVTYMEQIGVSTEGRDLVALKISTGGKNKPAILIDGGIHAREWIAGAVVLYIIQQLVENPKNYYLLKTIDWHFIPNINPDGYEYSHISNRMWRKTRSKGFYCDGVDANRNFEFQWGGPGTSSIECKEDYKGPYPFSEPEARALRDYVFKHPPNHFKLYVTFHSFGNFILYPWGYKPEAVENFLDHEYLGGRVRDAIRKFSGTVYSVETVSKSMGLGSGGSDDWMKGIGGADFSFCFELPGGGTSGFDLPPEKILPVVRETFEGIRAFHDGIDELYNK